MKISDEELGRLIAGGRLPVGRMRDLQSDPVESRRVAELVMLASKMETFGEGSPPVGAMSWFQNGTILRLLTVAVSLLVEGLLAFRTSYAIGWVDRWAETQNRVLWLSLVLAVVGLILARFVWPLITHRRPSVRNLVLPLLAFAIGAGVLWGGAAAAKTQRAASVDALLHSHAWCAIDPLRFNPYTKAVPQEADLVQQLQALGEEEKSTKRRFDGLITFRATGMGDLPRLAKEKAGFTAVIMGLYVDDDAGVAGSDAETAFKAEMSTAITAAPWVDAYCVGHNPSSKIAYAQLAAWMAQLRRETGKPVTTTLPLSYYIGVRGEQLRQLGDFAFVDVVPPFHGGTDPAAAVAHMREALRDVQNLPSGKPVLLKMVTYPSAGGPGLSEGNQDRFYRDLFHGVFFPPEVYVSVFAAYDVEWKSGTAWDEAEVHVGLITTDGRKKPAFDTVLQLWPTRRHE